MTREPNMLKDAIKMFTHPFYVIKIIALLICMYSERSMSNAILFALIIISILVTNIRFYIHYYKEAKRYDEYIKMKKDKI